MSNLPNTKVASVDDVKRLVSQAFNNVRAADDIKTDANDALKTAQQSANNEREGQLIAIAAAAHTQSWDGVLTEQGVDAAKAARNNQKDNSINTFAAQIKRACHPSVRQHIQELFVLAGEAWDAEKDADDKPLRKAFARKYHLVVGAMFDMAIAGNAPTTAQELVDAAMDVLRARELDYTKVKGRLDAIKAQLAKFHEDFPLDGIGACVEFLGEISKEDLKGCVVPKAAPVSEPVVEVEQDEPVEGASDILAEINQDLSALAA